MDLQSVNIKHYNYGYSGANHAKIQKWTYLFEKTNACMKSSQFCNGISKIKLTAVI